MGSYVQLNGHEQKISPILQHSRKQNVTKLAHLVLTTQTIFMISFPIFEVLLMLYPTCFASRALKLCWSLISHWPSSMLVFPCLLTALTNHWLCSEKGKSALSKALTTSSYTSTCKYLEGSIWAKTATQHGPSTAVHMYREDTPLSFQQNDISASRFYPEPKTQCRCMCQSKRCQEQIACIS